MEEKKIEVTLNEYREFIETKARVEAFTDFVKNGEFSVDRITCGAFLGFHVDNLEKRNGLKNE